LSELKTVIASAIKRLVTLSTYRRYINNCIYLSIYVSIKTLNDQWRIQDFIFLAGVG